MIFQQVTHSGGTVCLGYLLTLLFVHSSWSMAWAGEVSVCMARGWASPALGTLS